MEPGGLPQVAQGADRIQLCGRLAATIAGRPVEERLAGREDRLVFAYLVLRRLQPVDASTLVGVLWPERPPSDGEARIKRRLQRLRRVLGARLQLRPEIQLRLPGGAFIDVEAAAEAVHRAEAAVARGDWVTSWPAARVALHTARRTFLAGAQAPWIEAQRARLRDIERRALECTAATALGLGGNELGSAERSGRALIEREPLHERGYCYLMEALARRGSAAGAEQVYVDLTHRLKKELGISPSPETQSLHERLTRPASGSGVPAAPPDSPTRTFMFTDICDSTALVTTIGDQAWRHLLEWHDRLLTELIHEHRGEIMDKAGDGVFAAFDRAGDAVRCAVTLQRQLASHRIEHGFAPFVRVGLHSDRAVPTGGKYAGLGVHVAARVVGLAGPGEIVLTSATAATAEATLIQRRSVPLKGVAEQVEIGLLPWQ